jgi:hypothetical protein
MAASRRRQVSMMRRIAQALSFLRGEATAAALDEVAAAIGKAERSVSLISQNAPPADQRECGQGRCDEHRPGFREADRGAAGAAMRGST